MLLSAKLIQVANTAIDAHGHRVSTNVWPVVVGAMRSAARRSRFVNCVCRARRRRRQREVVTVFDTNGDKGELKRKGHQRISQCLETLVILVFDQFQYASPPFLFVI